MQINKKVAPIHTHEGATAQHITYELQLRRSVMSCMLFEKEFYESGESIAKRIAELVPKVSPLICVNIAIEAREKMGLRHVPLLIVREMARYPLHKRYVSRTLQRIITRPDQLSDFLALYWSAGKCPLTAKVKQGLAWAFQKFGEYELAKHLHNDRQIKLRDVLFLCHAKPINDEQLSLWKRLIANDLQTPDTWEVALSGGADKRETFMRLMSDNKLGTLAFIRNLRNMSDANVNLQQMQDYATKCNVNKIFPWQFIAAAKTNPQLEPMIEEMLFRCVADKPKIEGKTVIMVDVSGSMDDRLSSKSEMLRCDAAYGLAMLLRELCTDPFIITFSQGMVAIPLRRGFALRDAMHTSQQHAGTYLQQSINTLHNSGLDYDRIIIITDEQTHDGIATPKTQKAYCMNVASAHNGVGYGQWRHIDGFSSGVIDWLMEYERSFG